MKTILFITGFMLFVGTGYFIYHYCKQPQYDCRMYINYDYTDLLTAKPDKSLFAYTGLFENQWQGVQVISAPLTEFEYNVEHVSQIEKENMLVSNPEQRQKSIDNFWQKTTENLKLLDSEKTVRIQSSLYIHLARQLNMLSNSLASKKLDFIYSNLEESSDLFSIYNQKDRQLLISHPDEVKKHFLHIQPLQDLNGVTIYIVFNPQSIEDEKRFIVMKDLFQELFTNAGAQVFIKANLYGGI